MRIIKNNLEEIEHTCNKCESIFGYTKSDIDIETGAWYRTGVESSERNCERYVICPVCGNKIILEIFVEEF